MTIWLENLCNQTDLTDQLWSNYLGFSEAKQRPKKLMIRDKVHQHTLLTLRTGQLKALRSVTHPFHTYFMTRISNIVFSAVTVSVYGFTN